MTGFRVISVNPHIEVHSNRFGPESVSTNSRNFDLVERIVNDYYLSEPKYSGRLSLGKWEFDSDSKMWTTTIDVED